MEVVAPLEQTCRKGLDIVIEEDIPAADYAVSRDKRAIIFRDQKTGKCELINTVTHESKGISGQHFAQYWVLFTGRRVSSA